MPLIILLVIGVVVCLGVLGYLAEKRRREAFAVVARELGLRYTPGKDRGLARRFDFLDKLRQGSSRYAFNIVSGSYRGQEVMAFDYHYATHSTDSKGRRTTQHHYFSFFMLFHERQFPELRIYPEGFLSKFGQMLGFDDIDFESVEFSKAFCVRSKDKKFAYDICHTRMMDYLLRHRGMSLELERDVVAMGMDRRMEPDQLRGKLDQLIEIRELFPKYLFS